MGTKGCVVGVGVREHKRNERGRVILLLVVP